MPGSFFPSNDDKLLSWALNYKEIIETYATALGLTPDDVATEKRLCDDIITVINTLNTLKGQLNSAQDNRDNVLATSGGNLRAKISHHKTAAGFTTSIGEALKIITHSPTVDYATYKASIRAELYAGHVRIKFTKKGAEGINLYARKKGASNWNFVARATKSPYNHRFALEVENQPEHWEYRAFGVVSDLEVGIASDIIEIIVGN